MTVKELRDRLGELVVAGHGEAEAIFWNGCDVNYVKVLASSVPVCVYLDHRDRQLIKE